MQTAQAPTACLATQVRENMGSFSERYSAQSMGRVLQTTGMAGVTNFDAKKHPEAKSM